MAGGSSAGAGSAVPRLTQLLTPVLARDGHDLEGLEVVPAGRRRVVRLLVDKDGGTSLDEVAEVSRRVSEALDDIDAREPALLGGAYVLEVSSPGVDRPLTAARHWRRNVGRLVVAHLADGSTVQGRVARADDVEVQLGDRVLPLAEVVRGQVQVEFSRPGEPAPVADEDEPDEDEPEDDGPDGPDDDGQEPR